MTNEISTKPNLGYSVGSTASLLQSDYFGNRGERYQAIARGTLAELRRGVGTTALQDPLSIERVHSVLTPPLSDKEIGRSDHPSSSEEAAFQTLALFALHMQGATSPVHIQRTSFASACGRMTGSSDSGSLKPRFDAMLVSPTSRSQVTHMRSLVMLLRSKGIGFDYGQFAEDLRALKSPQRRPGVLLRWGRDFARGSYTPTQPEKEA